MPQSMGFNFGLERDDSCLKRKFRWLLSIPEISADDPIKTLPPLKSARPNISFKEVEVQHINESIFFPVKPEWKPINLVLYDLKKNQNPIFDWLKKIYDPEKGKWGPSINTGFKKRATLKLYDGCGELIESWIYDNVWPQAVEFGDLDMGNSEIVMIDVTLRFDRAYVVTE